jgi:hypothetical protein
VVAGCEVGEEQHVGVVLVMVTAGSGVAGGIGSTMRALKPGWRRLRRSSAASG